MAKPMYGQWKTATIAINQALSAEVSLGGDYEEMQIIIPTLTSCTVSLQVAKVTGGTFQDLGDGVATATTTGGYSTVFLLGGWQFIKVKTSVNQGAARTFSVRGSTG